MIPTQTLPCFRIAWSRTTLVFAALAAFAAGGSSPLLRSELRSHLPTSASTQKDNSEGGFLLKDVDEDWSKTTRPPISRQGGKKEVSQSAPRPRPQTLHDAMKALGLGSKQKTPKAQTQIDPDTKEEIKKLREEIADLERKGAHLSHPRNLEEEGGLQGEALIKKMNEEVVELKDSLKAGSAAASGGSRVQKGQSQPMNANVATVKPEHDTGSEQSESNREADTNEEETGSAADANDHEIPRNRASAMRTGKGREEEALISKATKRHRALKVGLVEDRTIEEDSPKSHPPPLSPQDINEMEEQMKQAAGIGMNKNNEKDSHEEARAKSNEASPKSQLPSSGESQPKRKLSDLPNPFPDAEDNDDEDIKAAKDGTKPPNAEEARAYKKQHYKNDHEHEDKIRLEPGSSRHPPSLHTGQQPELEQRVQQTAQKPQHQFAPPPFQPLHPQRQAEPEPHQQNRQTGVQTSHQELDPIQQQSHQELKLDQNPQQQQQPQDPLGQQTQQEEPPQPGQQEPQQQRSQEVPVQESPEQQQQQQQQGQNLPQSQQQTQQPLLGQQLPPQQQPNQQVQSQQLPQVQQPPQQQQQEQQRQVQDPLGQQQQLPPEEQQQRQSTQQPVPQQQGQQEQRQENDQNQQQTAPVQQQLPQSGQEQPQQRPPREEGQQEQPQVQQQPPTRQDRTSYQQPLSPTQQEIQPPMFGQQPPPQSQEQPSPSQQRDEQQVAQIPEQAETGTQQQSGLPSAQASQEQQIRDQREPPQQPLFTPRRADVQSAVPHQPLEQAQPPQSPNAQGAASQQPLMAAEPIAATRFQVMPTPGTQSAQQVTFSSQAGQLSPDFSRFSSGGEWQSQDGQSAQVQAQLSQLSSTQA